MHLHTAHGVIEVPTWESCGRLVGGDRERTQDSPRRARLVTQNELTATSSIALWDCIRVPDLGYGYEGRQNGQGPVARDLLGSHWAITVLHGLTWYARVVQWF